MTLMRVLVVDVEPQIQSLRRIALGSAGYDILPATTGREAIRLAAVAVPDAIILDLGLPDIDGKDVLRDIRTFSKVPSIMLSARDREAEKVAASDLGADDSVKKPVGMGELMARLRTAARASGAVTRVEIGNLVIDLDERLVTRAGTPIRLTPKEYDLSAVLARKAGRVVTHRQILTAVRGPAHHDDTQ